MTRHKKLADMDIESAEATAKLLNAGKISAGMSILEGVMFYLRLYF